MLFNHTHNHYYNCACKAQLDRIEKKLDLLTELTKSQQLDQAKIAALEQKMEEHTAKLKEALELGK